MNPTDYGAAREDIPFIGRESQVVVWCITRAATVAAPLRPLVLALLVYGFPETVPSISPVSVKSAGALEALRNTTFNVAL